MIHGFDTSFLVAAEVIEHPSRQAALAKLHALSEEGDEFAIAPQVLTEFIHAVTDSKRFITPLTMNAARDVAQEWWTAKEILQVTPGAEAVAQFFAWHRSHQLGRKRLLDTLLAATYRCAGVQSILTLNAADFAVLGGFQCITP